MLLTSITGGCSHLVLIILATSILQAQAEGDDAEQPTTTESVVIKENPETRAETTTTTEEGINTGLKKKFEELFEYYSKNKVTSDCKVEKSKDDDGMHHHWGTKNSLEFLSEKMSDKAISEGEKRIDRNKLRIYLARIGFLKNPGSIVFLDKQTQTMRLNGCKKNSVWRQVGEKGEDTNFQKYHYVGENLKERSPNSLTYIHKYTCFSVDEKCSHDFYVISKPLVEMPLGLQVSQGDTSGDYAFTCTMPFCQLKDCNVPGTKTLFNRRIYPPYTIKWNVPQSLKGLLGLGKDGLIDINVDVEKMKANAKIEVKFQAIIRNNKESGYSRPTDYTSMTDPLHDGFGDVFDPHADGFVLHSRIKVLNAQENKHSGPYECIVMDANGVATSPSKMFKDYRGKANINVMPFWQKWIPFAVTGGCCVLVFLIILICPKKMEYDDGTPYTKDELISPASKPAEEK